MFPLSLQVADPSIPIGISEIGTMTSIFPIAYGFRWVGATLPPSPFLLECLRPCACYAARHNTRPAANTALKQHCPALPAPPARLPAASL